MIPTKSDIDIQGTLPGEDVQMTLDSDSLSHLMSVLTNLYSNKTQAIVREYSTNALDSHIEAGQTKPIEVSTPTDFKPYFTVRDYGVGMDAETIRNVYSRYGASTKRGTNSQNGMLGLGSKSALTYTTQFKVIGVKDGIKTYVMVSRTEEGSGVMKIISQSETTEENGVTIEIPVSNRREIENVAYGFFRFWKPGTVLLNGKDPSVKEGIEMGRFNVTDEINGDHIVMGNVAYPIPTDNRIFKNYHSRTSVIAYVEMGEVNFTPSREALHLTQLTRNTLDKLREEFAAEVKKYITKQVEQAPTHSEAIKNYYEIQKSNLGVYSNNITYKGENIPHSVSFDWSYHLGNGSAYEAGYTEIKRLFSNKVIIIHGYEYEKIHTTHRQKLRLWLEANKKEDISLSYFTKTIPIPQWLGEVAQVHWDDVRAMKIERPKSANAQSDLYDTINDRGYRISGQKVDPKKTTVYASPATFAADESKDIVARFLTNRDDIQLVLVNKNKWKSFTTDIPKAIHLDDMVKQIIDDYVKNLTDAEKLFLRSNWKDRNFCAKLNPDLVLDPAIKAAVKALSTTGLSEKTAKKYELMQAVAFKWEIKTFPNLITHTDRLFEGYPLLNVYSHSTNNYPLEHIYLYLNSCYVNFIKK